MGGFRGHKSKKWGKSAKRLDRLAPNLAHIYADSSGNEHRLKNNYPLEIITHSRSQGGILRGLCGQKLKPGKCGQRASLIAG